MKLSELPTNLLGKRIIGVNLPEDATGQDYPPTGFDLLFDDGSEVEFYVIDGEITFVALSAEEAGGAHEERKRCA